MSQPFFSIVTPVYNRADCIVRTLDSIREQKDADYEVVLIDDDSKDDSVRIIRDYLEKYDLDWRMYINEHNQGQMITKNTGAEKSEGKYLVYLDSDDFFPDEMACHRMQEVITKNPDQVLFMFRVIGTDGSPVTNNPDFDGVLSFKDYFRKKVHGEYLPVVDKEAFDKVRYRPDLRSGTGLAWQQITQRHGSVYISNIVSRIYDNSSADRLSTRNKSYYKRYIHYHKVNLSINFFNYLRYYPKGGLNLLKKMIRARIALTRLKLQSKKDQA